VQNAQKLQWCETIFTLIFLRCFRDPIRVSRIREHYHWFPRIRAIGSLQVHTRFRTFSFKKPKLIYL